MVFFVFRRPPFSFLNKLTTTANGVENMTAREEMNYLVALLAEASTWKVSPDDPSDPLRLEILNRIENLMSSQEDEAEEETEIEEETETDHSPKRVRAWGKDGKIHWCREDECRWVLNSRGKKKRVLIEDDA